jgi:hypothetical protein
VWWVIWNRTFPDIYCLPAPLLHHRELSLTAGDEELAKLLMEDEEETSFDATIRQAWEATVMNDGCALGCSADFRVGSQNI